MIFAFFRMIPASVWVGLGTALLAVFGMWEIWHNGYEHRDQSCKVEKASDHLLQEQALEKEKARQAQVDVQVVTEYKDRIHVVKEKGDEIVKTVNVYVPIATPLLPPGWRVYHDAAASGVVPDSPERAIAAASPVEAAAAASTVAENYQSCRQTAEQLVALQKWATSMGERK